MPSVIWKFKQICEGFIFCLQEFRSRVSSLARMSVIQTGIFHSLRASRVWKRERLSFSSNSRC